MLSSSQETRDRDAALGLGAHTYCAKPPGPELFDTLSRAHNVLWTGPS